MAHLRSSNIQRAVIKTVNSKVDGDQLGEDETTAQLEVYMSARRIPPQVTIWTLERMSFWKNSLSWCGRKICRIIGSPTRSRTSGTRTFCWSGPRRGPSRQRRKAHVSRMSQIETPLRSPWNNPRDKHKLMRQFLPPGFYVGSSGKHSISNPTQIGREDALRLAMRPDLQTLNSQVQA